MDNEGQYELDIKRKGFSTLYITGAAVLYRTLSPCDTFYPCNAIKNSFKIPYLLCQ